MENSLYLDLPVSSILKEKPFFLNTSTCSIRRPSFPAVNSKGFGLKVFNINLKICNFDFLLYQPYQNLTLKHSIHLKLFEIVFFVGSMLIDYKKIVVQSRNNETQIELTDNFHFFEIFPRDLLLEFFFGRFVAFWFYFGPEFYLKKNKNL